MKNILFTILILTIGFNTLYAQGEQSASLIKEFNINTIEAYFFEPNVTQDSSLVTIENFNKEGRRTKIEIYDSLGLTNHYEYYYQLDTIKTERRTFFKNELVSLTELKYNKYGNEISAIEYDSSGVELGMSSVNTYNDKQQLVDLKVYDDGRIIFQEKNKYYNNGNRRELKIVKPNHLKRTDTFKENGELKYSQESNYYWNEEVFENYRFSEIKMVQQDSRRSYKTKEIGVCGVIALERFDDLRSQIFYLKNGLIDYEIQFVNGKCIGTKNYNYVQN